ncbi:chemotaxis protein CheW [Geobacter sp. DSM 9736]|uniref:chemotaxis protein CheW n=1 Tax=Geobacter sp. DSM 9736 TaxID=1277350 RepID=UPI000B511CFD|nr:chemotaxis protein CheW [Geobacter sp. DSM 9736]
METPRLRRSGEPERREERLVLFSVEGHRLALPLRVVEKVVQAVEVTPLPGAPEEVAGVIDIAGTITLVIDLRRRLGIPPREILLTDQLLIARTPRRMAALLVDSVEGVLPGGRLAPASQILSGLEAVEGVLTLPDGLVVIHDLDILLAPLDGALPADSGGGP